MYGLLRGQRGSVPIGDRLAPGDQVHGAEGRVRK